MFPWFVSACIGLALPACDKKDSGTAPAGTTEPTAVAAPAAPAAPTQAADATTAPTPETPPVAVNPAPAAPTPEPEASPTPAPAPAAPVEADDGVKPLGTHVLPGMVVRDTLPRTPERAIQDVLRAALEPDEEKGWEMFKALLHTDELLPNALITRRSMNFAASRRKVHLFLVEKAEVPVFKVARILDEGNDSLRFFVHNPESMPTPCVARIDRNLNPPAWRIGVCSL
jgi:hypothetical protein